LKLKCPHCQWSKTVSKEYSDELIIHIFITHWHNIRRKIKKQDQKKFRAETRRELAKEKKRKNKRDRS